MHRLWLHRIPLCMGISGLMGLQARFSASEFSFVCNFYKSIRTHAAGRLLTLTSSVPGWIQSRSFRRSDASRQEPFGYTCSGFSFLFFFFSRRLVPMVLSLEQGQVPAHHGGLGTGSDHSTTVPLAGHLRGVLDDGKVDSSSSGMTGRVCLTTLLILETCKRRILMPPPSEFSLWLTGCSQYLRFG